MNLVLRYGRTRPAPQHTVRRPRIESEVVQCNLGFAVFGTGGRINRSAPVGRTCALPLFVPVNLIDNDAADNGACYCGAQFIRDSWTGGRCCQKLRRSELV